MAFLRNKHFINEGFYHFIIINISQSAFNFRIRNIFVTFILIAFSFEQIGEMYFNHFKETRNIGSFEKYIHITIC